MDTLIPLIASVVFGGVGFFLLRFVLSERAALRKKVETSLKADGVVVRMLRDTSDSETYFHYPVVRFTTGKGEQIEFEASIRREPPRHKVGDRVPVYYDPANPGDADILGTEQNTHIVLLLLGVPALLAGLGIFFKCVLLQSCPAG